MKNLSIAINNIVAEKMKTNQKEVVSNKLSHIALHIIKNKEIETQKDVLVFCAALNVLNTYVKQKDSKMGYFFKSYINRLFVALKNNEIPGIKIGMDIDVSRKGNAIAYVIVQIENVQFSFHQIKVTNEAAELIYSSDIVTDLQFDGLRKQKCAVTIFEMAQVA